MSEGYVGVKFTTVYKDKIAPLHPHLDELKNWCRLFHDKGLAPPYPGGSYGNLSFRTERDSFIITGTCIGLKDTLGNDCFVEIHDCNADTKEILVTGNRPPSSETFMHYIIYHNRPDVQAIFHGHNQQITENAALLTIPETAKEVPYGTVELAESVLAILGNNNFFVIKAHGFVSLGGNMDEAGKLACAWLEQTPQIKKL
ncbi:MAG: class II aldolase/adducin family protein [Bacteroidota bacterium]